MSVVSLKLSYLNNTVILNRFFENGCKLSHEPIGDVAYSISGTPIDSGIQYEQHRIYTIEALLSSDELFKLDCLFKSAEKARTLWNPAINYAIVLEDFIHHYKEPGNTQSRAVATDGTIVSTGFGLSYPAKFKVRVLDYDSDLLRQNRSISKARFTLKETDRVFP